MNPNDNTNPQSRIWLCKTNLENDYKNTLTFSSATAQINYFIGNPNTPNDTGTATKSYTDFTYLRLERWIKVPDFIEDIDTNNYLVLVNKNKYYYYFITSMEYIDSQTTRINIELDVMQTYFFDITYTQSFIEREHVTDDIAGNHTLPENLELGEFIINGDPVNLNTYANDTYIALQVTQLIPELADIDHLGQGYNPHVVNGVFQGCYTFVFSSANQAQSFIYVYDKQGLGDAIIGCFIIPKEFANQTGDFAERSFEYNGVYYWYSLPKNSASFITMATTNVTKPTTVDGYTPKNKKLLVYPFSYFNVTNNAGACTTFRYEDFTGTPSFKVLGSITPGCSTKCIPLSYKHVTDNNTMKSFDYGIVGGKFPVCSWNSDMYTNWLTQNGLNNTLNTISAVGQIATGAFLATTGVGAVMAPQMIGSGIGSIIDVMREKHNAEFIPNQSKGNNNAGDITFSTSKNVFTAYKLSIRQEVAKAIDNFFTMYGYQVNVVKSPNIHTRTYWNYLKTQNCNFTGNIPQQYMLKIKQIFDGGITFWHDPSNMFNYSLTNSVLS